MMGGVLYFTYPGAWHPDTTHILEAILKKDFGPI